MRKPFTKKVVTSASIEEFNDMMPKEKRDKIPPGQRLAKRWPVLSAEPTPKFNGKDWNVNVEGLVENPIKLTWEEFKQLPKVSQTSDIHCVTTWSLLDQNFGGVSFKTILDIVKPLPEANYVTFEAYSGYSSALPLKEGYLLENDVLLAYEHNGKLLDPDHGGPLRSLVPQLYLWKSVKWLTTMRFTKEWERGFWEVRGYHQRGDPWLSERYSSQERPRKRDHKIST
jgi:DMSO/TMAO reductase YedYZ molybdopterin-dependent catalytic subunit